MQKLLHGDEWYCPALEKGISHGVCWEYCFAENCGPVDTTLELRDWIEQSGKYKDIGDFHKVCEKCSHNQWSK